MSGAVRDAEYEVHGANQTEGGPEVIESEGLPHVKDCKRDEHHQRDHFLQDLELAQRKRGISDPVGRNLKQILEQRYSPAHEGRDIPWAVGEIPQVRVPGERHEDIREQQQTCGAKEDRGRNGSSGVS